MAAALALPAQENPLSTEAQQSWTRTKNNLIAAAEKMSEEHYSFKPAPESQSFGVLVSHTADSAMGQCSRYNGEAKKLGAGAMTAKADLVNALKSAMAECDKSYSSLTDAKATEMIAGGRGSASRIGTLYRNTIHMEHEYAQMAVHLRLKGLVPPSSDRGGGRGRGL
jgi:uncharacterized damage-inducible protein DinB